MNVPDLAEKNAASSCHWQGEPVTTTVGAPALTRDGSIPPEVVAFAVFGPKGHGPTMGANRNAILLRTAGTVLLTVDDDTICEPRTVPGAAFSGRLRIGNETNPSAFWFFPTREAALRFTRTVDVDVAGAHEALLGWPVSTLIDPATGGVAVDLDGACVHVLRGIWSGKARVAITLNGVVGDSGMYSSGNLRLIADPGSRARMLASAATYNCALTSRELLRQAEAATVCHPGPLMGGCVGLDNRLLLPPFFPAYRAYWASDLELEIADIEHSVVREEYASPP